MSIEGEPRNGDYAAYIEALARRGAGPGQTLQQLDSQLSRLRDGSLRVDGFASDAGRTVPPVTPREASRSGWSDMPTQIGQPEVFPTPGSGPAPYTPYTPAPRSAPTVPGQVSRQPTDDGEEDAPTLSKQNERQRVSIVMLIVGGVIGLIGASMALEGLIEPGGDVIPGLFLLVFAWIFLRGAWRQRRRASTPLAKLPPLSTISRRDRRG